MDRTTCGICARPLRPGERGLCTPCANRETEAEHAFELRAAFGPGVEVVNVITGERTTT